MDLCRHNNYRPIQRDEILDQFRFSELALREEAKFFKFQCSSDWPSDLNTARENLLFTTRYETELSVYKGVTNKIITNLLAAYRRFDPANSAEKESAFWSGVEYSSQKGGADANTTTTENLETNHIPSINHVEQSGASSQSWESVWWDKCRHADEFLERSGTQCLNM